MKERQKKQIIQDIFFVTISVIFAVVIARSGILHDLAASFSEFRYSSIFLAGMFFTSVFTTAPSIAMLAELAQGNSIFLVAILGGFGAMVGDYLIFSFFHDRISQDIKYLRKHSEIKRLPAIFRTRLFHWFMPFVGAFIIASPLPDELGLMLLGLSRMNERAFLLISFTMNTVGILIIGMIAIALM